MSIEFELKFAATPQAQQALRAALADGFVTIRMETTYFDTPRGDLAARKWTLRRRLENGVSVCTLKTPAGSLGRNECEINCERIEEAIDMLCKLSGQDELPILAAHGLVPICGARFTRLAKTLQTGDAEVEVALDSGVLLGGGLEMPLCEVEVELKSGPPQEAALYAQIIAQKFGLTPEKRSKFRRAYDLAQKSQKEE